MIKQCSRAISWGCTALLVLIPAGALYLLWNIDAFAGITRDNMQLATPIQWTSVEAWQWYAEWGLTVAYVAIGLAGLIFLRRAFAHFAHFTSGELFTPANCLDIRRFAVLLLVQAVAAPVHFALSGVLLSFNHPAGQNILAVAIGSDELTSVAIALVLWTISHLLVEGHRLQSENRQFV